MTGADPPSGVAARIDTVGASIAYERIGAGPPVLLVQGVGIIGRGWRPLVDALRDAFSLLWFDHRGIGESIDRGGPVTIEAMAADALALMDAEQLPSCHVIGHSMGGVIAQEIALRAPARVRSLTLLCTFARGRDATTMTPGLLWTGLRTRVGTRAMRRRAFLDLVMPKEILAHADLEAVAARLADLFGHDLADPPPIVMRQLRATARYDARSRLARLAPIPTLVVSGTDDRIARPSSGRALAASIPGARYVELRGAAHGVPIYAPGLVNPLIREHLLAADRRG